MAKTTNFPLREINQAGVLAAESISHLHGLLSAIRRAAAEPGGHADEIKRLCDIGMYLVRLNEHAGTKRMALPLENAVEKLRRWQREKHFTSRR